uniref:EGF-like domain-containing protein n=1 Tax=Strongyloides papillosus TaxID=174720 RepID=A0A0N5CBA8_STREA
MNLSLLIILISMLCALQNVAESKKSSEKKKSKPYKKPPYPTSPESVMYYISTHLGTQLTNDIDNFLKYLSHVMCLDFKRQKDSVKNNIGINFYSKKYNKVGLSTDKKKPTKVYLKKGLTRRELLFFIGNALGLVSEITRYDSKRYVKVFENNIQESYFEKYYEVRQYDSDVIANTSFDFYSTMLPSPKFKSKNGRETYTFISDLSKYYEKTVYTTKFFSFSDVKRLWYLYCSDKCKEKDICMNNGFLKKDYRTCICPSPFTGEKCEELYLDQENCSNKQEFIATSYKSFYTIKNIFTLCYYSIKSNNGKKVRFNIEYLNISHINDCSFGVGLRVKYREDKGAGDLYLCGNYANISFPPLSNEVNLRFYGYGNNRLDFSIKEE